MIDANGFFAFCQTHGLFQMFGIAYGGNSSVQFENCVTNCPTCGCSSEIIPGIYTQQSNGINLLLSSSISLQALGAIRNIIEQVDKQEISVDEARVEVEKIAPGTGNIFDISSWSPEVKAAMLGVIGLIAAAKLNQSPTQNVTTNIYNQPVIERVIEKNYLLRTSKIVPLPSRNPKRKND